MIEDAEKDRIVKTDGPIRSAVDRARAAEVAQELRTLVLALAGIEGSGFDPGLVNRITASSTIRIRRKT
jgi:hypothetical protein